MKPFSKFEAISGKPVVTRDGRKVTQLKEFEFTGPYQIVGVIEGADCISSFTYDGRFNLHGTGPQDLFMADDVQVGWVAFGLHAAYMSERGLVAFCTHVWPTEEAAKDSYRDATGKAPKGTQKLVWEE